VDFIYITGSANYQKLGGAQFMSDKVGVTGQFQKTLRLEAPLELVYGYFTDFNFVLPRLPEIDRVLRYKDGRYRMIFAADDGRGHEMGVVFDVRHEMEACKHVKTIPVPVRKEDLKSDPMSNSGPLFPGTFAGETILLEKGNHVEVLYKATLHIDVEVPRFLSFLPTNMLHKMGDSLMNFKLNSVGEGLTRTMHGDFKLWCEKNAHSAVREREKVGAAVRGKELGAGESRVRIISQEKSASDLN
jgi:hypothetical protein